ncbi:hypothetical protein NDN08_001882 [Rhodosorus marinus]|uniref:HTH myb-type domain-containing protein n=1 Tax=Rhodosorus marinus TaxID=101924 RepID=A0AAV8US34_9RHOD|nr:hypothetical protein NDN08_001882 [Rhodosorus marinus]
MKLGGEFEVDVHMKLESLRQSVENSASVVTGASELRKETRLMEMNNEWAREASEETVPVQEVGDMFLLSTPNELRDDENMWLGNGLVRDVGGLDAWNNPEQKGLNDTRQIRDKFFEEFNVPLRDDENRSLGTGLARDAGGCLGEDEMLGLDASNHLEQKGLNDTRQMRDKCFGECNVPLPRERPLLETGKRPAMSGQKLEQPGAQRVKAAKPSDYEGKARPRNPQSRAPSQNEESSRACCPALPSSVGDEFLGRRSRRSLEDQAMSRMIVEIRSDTSTSAKLSSPKLPPRQELAQPEENSEAQEQAGTRSLESAMENAQRTISIKKRLVWTQDLHERFLRAVNVAGIENAVPKTILEIMDVKGLTTEHVKSHLQKFRNNLRKSKTDASEFAGRDCSGMQKFRCSPSRLGISESLGARTMDESKAGLNARQTVEKQWELHESGTQLLLSQQILLRKIAHFHRRSRMRGKEEPKSENEGKDQVSGGFITDFYNLQAELDDLQQQLKRQTEEYERIGKQLQIL